MFCLLSFQVRITLKLKMYCLLTAKAIDITHFLLESYKTTRTKYRDIQPDIPIFLCIFSLRKTAIVL